MLEGDAMEKVLLVALDVEIVVLEGWADEVLSPLVW